MEVAQKRRKGVDQTVEASRMGKDMGKVHNVSRGIRFACGGGAEGGMGMGNSWGGT